MFGPFTCARTVPAQHTDHCHCYRNTRQSSSDTVVIHSDRTNHKQQLSSSIFVFNFLLIKETCGTEPQIDSLAMKCREGQITASLNWERTFCVVRWTTWRQYTVICTMVCRYPNTQNRHLKKSSTVTGATNLLRTQQA